MSAVTLSAARKGKGYQATLEYPDGITMSSAETYPTIAEAIIAAAAKLLDSPKRLMAMDRPEIFATK